MTAAPEVAETSPALPSESVTAATLALKQVESGKMTLAEAIASVLGESALTKVASSVPALVVPEITKAQREALERIVEVYGQVTPKEPRRLTRPELRALVEERETIDLILGFIKKRKEESIREALANHMDKVLEAQPGFDPKTAPKDARGHYVVKHEDLVEGTDKKVSAIVSEPKPVIDGVVVHEMYMRGEITHAEWLAVTSKPVVPRVFDESKARESMKKNPALLFKIAKATKQPAPTLTIKVAKA